MRTLSKPERNYDKTQRECLAIVWALFPLRVYLAKVIFTLRMDHDSLRWFLNLYDASDELHCWRWHLAEFQCDVAHRPGFQHSAGDALSRLCTDLMNFTPLCNEIPTFSELSRPRTGRLKIGSRTPRCLTRQRLVHKPCNILRYRKCSL